MKRIHILLSIMIILVVVCGESGLCSEPLERFNLYRRLACPKPLIDVQFEEISPPSLSRMPVDIWDIDGGIRDYVDAPELIFPRQHTTLRVFDLGALLRVGKVRKAIICYIDEIVYGIVEVLPLGPQPPIVGPISDPFDENFNLVGSFEMLYLWLSEQR